MLNIISTFHYRLIRRVGLEIPPYQLCRYQQVGPDQRVSSICAVYKQQATKIEAEKLS